MRTRTRSDHRKRRPVRVRKRVVGTSERPRLAVFRSNKHIGAQLVDDIAGRTLAGVSTTQSALRTGATGNKEAAQKVGVAIAEKAKSLGVEKVVFDRGGFLYHGRVAAIAQAARDAGLKF